MKWAIPKTLRRCPVWYLQQSHIFCGNQSYLSLDKGNTQADGPELQVHIEMGIVRDKIADDIHDVSHL